jgi:hypothetical protein
MPDLLAQDCQLTLSGVGVEKVHFPQNSKYLGDRKCLGKLRKSFAGLPSAILFSRISPEGVFQQPQAITLKCPAQGHDECNGDVATVGCVVADLAQRSVLDRHLSSKAVLCTDLSSSPPFWLFLPWCLF